MKLPKLFRIYQSLLVSLGIIGLCVIGWLVGVFPLVQKSITLFDTITSSSKDIATMQTNLSMLRGLDDQLLHTQLQTVMDAVPADSSVSSVMAIIDSLAGQNGVSITSLSVARPGSLATDSAKTHSGRNGSMSIPLPLKLSVVGPYDHVVSFLTASIFVRRVLRINSFSVTIQSPDNASATVTMDALYAPLPSSMNTLTQSVSPLTNADTDLVTKIANLQIPAQSTGMEVAPSSGAGKADPFSQ